MAEEGLFRTLEITRSDIDEGVCGNRSRCMIAIAIKRKLGLNRNHYVTVDEHGIAFTVGGLRYHLEISATEKRRAKEFDEDKSRAKPHTMVIKQWSFAPIPQRSEAKKKRQNAANLRNRQAKKARGEPIEKRIPRFV